MALRNKEGGMNYLARKLERSGAVLISCASFLVGCQPVVSNTDATASIGLDYASTSLGFRNSGALSAGRLMLWDTASDELVDLESDIPLAVSANTPPANLAATNVSGITVSANVGLNGVTLGDIGATVSRELEIDVKDASRETSSNVLTALSTTYRTHLSEGADVFRTWRVADVTGDPDRFRYVLLVDPVRASSESVRFKNETSANANVTAIDTVQGTINLSVPNNATASCNQADEERAICFINARVLRAFLNANGNLDYEPVSFSKTKLATAFRKQ